MKNLKHAINNIKIQLSAVKSDGEYLSLGGLKDQVRYVFIAVVYS